MTELQAILGKRDLEKNCKASFVPKQQLSV